MNEILFIITTILCFVTTLLFYKYLGKYGLFVWISIATIISNIETVKLVNIFGMETSLGTILYASTFLTTDILNEKYGEKAARRSVYYGLLSMIVMTIFMSIALLYDPSSNDFANESLKTIFTLNMRITLASIIAFVVSQLLDAHMYNKIKEKSDKLWLRNNLSTMISQLIDTVLFALIAYKGLVTNNTLVSMMVFMYIFKLMLAVIDTPFMYLSKKIKPNEK